MFTHMRWAIHHTLVRVLPTQAANDLSSRTSWDGTHFRPSTSRDIYLSKTHIIMRTEWLDLERRMILVECEREVHRVFHLVRWETHNIEYALLQEVFCVAECRLTLLGWQVIYKLLLLPFRGPNRMPGGGIAGLKARQQNEPIKLNAYKNSSHLLGRVVGGVQEEEAKRNRRRSYWWTRKDNNERKEFLNCFALFIGCNTTTTIEWMSRIRFPFPNYSDDGENLIVAIRRWMRTFDIFLGKIYYSQVIKEGE